MGTPPTGQHLEQKRISFFERQKEIHETYTK